MDITLTDDKENPPLLKRTHYYFNFQKYLTFYDRKNERNECIFCSDERMVSIQL